MLSPKVSAAFILALASCSPAPHADDNSSACSATPS
jgi:hypothetical protein